MNKPLSETHPTLFSWYEKQPVNARAGTGLTGLLLVPIEEVQSCTLDKAEHERIVAKLDSYWREQVEAEKKHVEEYTLRRVNEAIETEIDDWNKGTTPEQKYVDHCVKATLVRLRDYRLGLDDKDTNKENYTNGEKK